MNCNIRRTYKMIQTTLMNRNIYNTHNGPLLKFCHGRNNFIDENCILFEDIQENY